MNVDLPEPLVPSEVDLRDFQYMELDVRVLRDSRFAAQVSGDAFRAGVLLWCASWHQVPASSLPDDDLELANLAGYGRFVKEWKKVREEALMLFVKCSDGRLYHRTVAEKALAAWRGRLQHHYDRARDRLRKLNKARGVGKLQALPELSFNQWNAQRLSSGTTMDSADASGGIPETSGGIPETSGGIPETVCGIPETQTIDSAEFQRKTLLEGEGEGEGEGNKEVNQKHTHQPSTKAEPETPQKPPIARAPKPGPVGPPTADPPQTEPDPPPEAQDVPEPEPERATEPDPVPEPVAQHPTPTALGLACRAMRSSGLPDANPAHPKLAALVAAGITEAELADAAREAAIRQKGFAYALGIAEGRRRDAATVTALPANPQAQPPNPDIPWPSVNPEGWSRKHVL